MRDVFRRMMNAAIISAIAALASKKGQRVPPAGATTTGPAMNTAFAIFSNGACKAQTRARLSPSLQA